MLEVGVLGFQEVAARINGDKDAGKMYGFKSTVASHHDELRERQMLRVGDRSSESTWIINVRLDFALRRRRRHIQPLDFQRLAPIELENATVSNNNLELRSGEKDGYASGAGESLSTAASPVERDLGGSDLEEEKEMKQQQGDKRRESSRLRVKPSKFRESSIPVTVLPRAKVDHKGGSDDGSSSMEIMVPVEVKPSLLAGQSLTHLDFDVDKPPSHTWRRHHIKGMQHKPSRSSDTLGSTHESFTSSSPRKALEDNGLKAALAVLKRVMQIKSAEPFNEPVDPMALGIPDYFDVIKEPMDFASIREALESGTKYNSAQEVYEDVQLIWSNCRQYNQEGDPIMDIMKTAETVFNRHWNAAGLQEYVSSSKSIPMIQAVQEGNNEGDSDQEDDMEEEEEEDDVVEDPRRRYTESKATQKHLKAVKVVHFDTPLSKTKGRKDDAKKEQQAEVQVQMQSELEVDPPLTDTETPSYDSPTPSASKRRTFGTAHHKPDCICVVCTGRRRKLAKLALVQEKRDRDGNEEQLVDETMGSAPVLGSKKKKKEPKLRIAEKTGKKSDVSGNAVNAASTPGDSDSVVPDLLNDYTSDPEPTVGTSVAAKADGRQFYPANYELPLRKVSPAVLQIGQYLFGSTRPSPTVNRNSPAKERRHSLLRRRMLEAVELMAWSEKKPAQV
ncbi:hypothetical protein R1sor_017898 [Riccia sorocarpa]|uniref:Bromo domain-containing protein n=1 Tax=Riccia sorocarpa TaxID=122646 RepID=A0ABD3I8L9_9MARC